MNDEALVSIRRKLRAGGIKVATVISRCEALDRNRDELIHVDDLEKVLRTLLVIDARDEDNMLTKRELRELNDMMGSGKERGEVEYSRLQTLLEPAAARQQQQQEQSERWRDDIEVSDRCRGAAASSSSKAASTRRSDPDYWATSRGSVGEWLANAACPAEIKNFKRFIASMERFERESGVRLEQLEGGDFVVPLGPDLRVTMSFSTGGARRS